MNVDYSTWTQEELEREKERLERMLVFFDRQQDEYEKSKIMLYLDEVDTALKPSVDWDGIDPDATQILKPFDIDDHLQ